MTPLEAADILGSLIVGIPDGRVQEAASVARAYLLTVPVTPMEEREAWDRYYASVVAGRDRVDTVVTAASAADVMLKERRARFGAVTR